MFFTCGPNEAMVVSGFCRSPPVMVAGGRVLVIPCLQQIQRISLNTLTLPVRSEKVYTRHGVPISVTGIAQVKIQGQNKEMLAAACQMFLGKSESEIGQIALETLEGHQRAIMAHMTVEEIYKDRQKFSDQVFRVASSDLVNMGISVVSYTLKDVHDEQDYLRSLGKGRTAQVQRDACVGEAEAKRDAGIREARARQEQVSAQLLSEEATARAQRDFQVAQAECDGAVSARRATAELAFQLQPIVARPAPNHPITAGLPSGRAASPCADPTNHRRSPLSYCRLSGAEPTNHRAAPLSKARLPAPLLSITVPSTKPTNYRASPLTQFRPPRAAPANQSRARSGAP
ncbi:flotillin-1-like [Agelaius tricolor]|uniref:flotillin-1-like n=1 Tax=Agelaius tricolor TaxID=9191 RepID=UPI0039F25EBD